ncbi:hypothetical protein [Metabacillus idriensis]|uniref:hypothetical protein n=1 Tax=Metabacillus idriensis TaxID=324768 RepID=UPI003D2CCD96
MNEKGMNVLAKGIIAGLSETKRNVYRYIESREDELASQCETKEQFLTMLVQVSPYHEAANRFSISVEEIYRLMKETEAEINKKLEQQLSTYKWIDCTERIENGSASNKKHFLFLT